MAEEQDKTHRLLFAFPRMVEELVRFCLGGDWVNRLDFLTLEQVPERLLSPELVRREQDVLWRLKYLAPKEDEDEWFYVYIHLEHLSRPKRLIALDTTAYKLLVHQGLARRKGLVGARGKKKLPPIFSVVIYTGEKKWKPITSLLELLEPMPEAPEGLDLWSFRYIDLQRYPLDKWIGMLSPLLGLFRLERLQALDELPSMTREIRSTLSPEDQDLADAFVSLINEVVLRRLTPKGAPVIRITDLEEVPSMLAQRIDNITRGWEMQGWKKGEAEGRKMGEAEGRKMGEAEGRKMGEAEGRKMGEAKGWKMGRKMGRREETARLFLELYATKFGAVPDEVRKQAASASQDQLEIWAKRLLTAHSPENIFKD